MQNPPSSVDTLISINKMEYALAGKRLGEFIKGGWSVLEPKNPLLWGWHLDLICEHLEAVKLKQIKRLIINIPPRNLKSIQCTIAFPAWCWTDDPSLRFLSSSYSQSLSTKHSVDRRMLINSKWYQTGWGQKFYLTDDQDTKTEFSNDKRGHMIATSMHGTATGKGGDILIVDDPHDTTIAESDVQRTATIQAFDHKFTTRLDNKKDGAIIIVMQRLHPKDLTGHLMAQGGWTQLKLPAEAEEYVKHVFPVSGKYVERDKGEILHPEREGEPELTQMKRALGSQGYAGQYQQRPSAAEGAIIKRAWIKFYTELPARLDLIIQSWDCAFKDSKDSDFVAGQVWGKYGADKYLIDRVKDKMDLPATMNAIRTMTAKHPKTYRKLVEDKANGPAVMQLLTREIPGLIPVEPNGSKEARVHSIAPDWEAGNIWLPHPSIAPWIHDYIEEIVTFPKSVNDDEIDSTSQAVIDLRSNSFDFSEKLIPSKIKSQSSGLNAPTETARRGDTVSTRRDTW